jgi:hypothetical protein
MDAINILAQYFRVEEENIKDEGLEVIIDQRLEIKCLYFSDTDFIFYGYFGDKIQEKDIRRLSNMLQWNFARIADNEDTLSIESESNRLCLFRKKPLSSLFIDNILIEAESFISNVEFWADAFDYGKEVPRDSKIMVWGF